MYDDKQRCAYINKALSERAAAEVDLAVMRRNAAIIKGLLAKDSRLMCVVKANAYGHGAVPAALELAKEGIKDFGVSTAGEGIELRKNGIRGRILVFSHIQSNMIKEAIENELAFTVCSLDYAAEAAKQAAATGKAVKLHIKLDTGMGRLGFLPDKNSFRDIGAIAKLAGAEIEGLFSHLSDSESDNEYNRRQLDVFLQAASELEKLFAIPCRHIANSGAVLLGKQYHLDMVRAGRALYGFNLSEAYDLGEIAIRPVLTLKSFVAFLKTVEAGTSIGYSGTYITKRKTVTAILPIGYADGVSRLLSNKGYALIRGRRAPVIGNISMDMMTLDVTDIESVSTGDEAVLIGTQQSESITAREIAELSNTVAYESLTGISDRVKRIYYTDGGF